jgi:D-alanyl-D-alanine carboxypeptidase/D-alanyl-D-alanine-endopeptidase (penicillin-binding protein 4)
MLMRFAVGLTLLVTACAPAAGGSASTPALTPTPAPTDTARLAPRILREPAPASDSAVFRPVLITETVAMLPPRTRARLELRRLVDSLVAEPMWRSAHWGVLVVDPESGDTLHALNAEKLFVPASNAKLVTGAVALAQLGGDYRYTTRILGRAPRRDGTVPGDLVVVGTGDPSVSDSLSGDAMAPLRWLADSLAARGVKRISGRLIRGADTFSDAPLGAGWAWDDLDDGYAAPVDELMFNEGFARVTVFGGARPGTPVTVRVRPAADLPRITSVDVVTERNCCMLRSRVTATGDVRGARPTIALSGSVRAGDSVTVSVALRHPAAAFLDAFREALRARGITVARGVEADSLADTTGLVLLATRTSPPLASILPAFQKPSQNQIGEVLLKTLGRERGGAGRADSGLVVIRRQLAEWGVDSTRAVLRDGSGLSRHNFLSPTAIVRVLDAMRRRDDFDVYAQSLPVAGVDGTLRERLVGTLAAGNARAKTGTLDKVRALSGYVTTADGRTLLFSVLVNNQTVPAREVERVQDAIVAHLAAMDLAGR